MTYLETGKLGDGAPDFENVGIEFYIQREGQALYQLVGARSKSQYPDGGTLINRVLVRGKQN
jgi:hypothetical protein